MTALTCSVCGEAVIPAPGTTRLGYSHEGASDHEVELAFGEPSTEPAADVVIESEERILARGRAAAKLYGLPPIGGWPWAKRTEEADG